MGLHRLVGILVEPPWRFLSSYGPYIFLIGLIAVAAMFLLLFRVETVKGRSQE
jgi:hypothetical protein